MILDTVELVRNSDDKSFDYVSKFRKYSLDQNYRIYYRMKELDLLAEFQPTEKIYALDFEKIELWKKYNCSRFWKKYYESDKIKNKYASMGINYDELNETENSEDDIYGE